MSIIYDAYAEYLRNKQIENDADYVARKVLENGTSEKGNLWSSDLGKCHRAAILRTVRTPGKPTFDTRGLDYMNTGVITEDETLKALQFKYGKRLTDQVILKHGGFSGKADFGIDIGTPEPILIEHKTTSEKHISSDQSTVLPKKEHVGQAMSYEWMYSGIHGITPKVILAYKTWGNFIEFELVKQHETILIISDINGVRDVKKMEYDVYTEIEELQRWYINGEIPPRLEKKYKGCEFMGKPSCKFYDYCWGENG